jgi:8-oxo-dGTP pyrophosphatase MutT (NUDIX family)
LNAPEILHVRRIEARCAPFRWRWAEANRAAIAAHWAKRRAATPRLYNGPVLLVSEHAISGEVLRATFFRTDFASFLAFKEFGFPDRSVANGFAMAALQATDGAFLLGVMGAQTANRGHVYFPAGTPDPSDLRPDGVDLAGSVIRELREETGLSEGDVQVLDRWTVVRHGATLAFMRPVLLSEDADAARRRILAYLARQESPELADIVIARGPADIDARMPVFVRAHLADAFARSGPEPASARSDRSLKPSSPCGPQGD